MGWQSAGGMGVSVLWHFVILFLGSLCEDGLQHGSTKRDGTNYGSGNATFQTADRFNCLELHNS